MHESLCNFIFTIVYSLQLLSAGKLNGKGVLDYEEAKVLQLQLILHLRSNLQVNKV
jgi:hypothetical protein